MSIKRWWILGVVVSVLVSANGLVLAQGSGEQGPGAVTEPLPAGALKRLGTMRLRHGSRILCLDYSPDGRFLAGGGGDDPIRVWDTASGLEVRQFKDTWASAMAFSPGGRFVVSAGAFKLIRIWEMDSGTELAKLKANAPVKALAMASYPDGPRFASGDQEGTIILWELAFSKEITRFQGHTGEVNSLAFSPGNRLLASGGGDRTVRIWDLESKKAGPVIDGRCAVSAVVFIDGKTLASAGDDNLIHLWDAGTGKHLKELAGHQGTVVSLRLGGGGKTLISGAYDKTIRLWNIDQGKQISQIACNAGDSDALALSPDGKQLAAAGFNNTIRRWQLPGGKEIEAGPGHQSPITALAVSPNGKLLVAGSALARIRLWDLTSGKVQRHWAGPLAGDLILAFAPDGKTIASAAGTDAVRLWNADTGTEKAQLSSSADEVLSLCFSSDGKTLAIGQRHQSIRLWDISQNRVVHQLKYPGPVQALAFSRDGKTLAASGAGKIALYDAANGQELRQIGPKEGPLPAVASMAFAPDGKTLASGSFDGIIRLWDAASGDKLRDLEGHQAVVYALSFSRDGRNLASGSFDKTVCLWEVFSGKMIITWKGHNGPVGSVAMTPNGRKAISGSTDTTLILWDVTGRTRDGKIQPLAMTPQELQNAWRELASEDAPRGNRVLWDLVASGKESVPFLGSQVFLVDPQKIRKLIEDLNDNKYLVREKASGELAKYGRWIEGVLTESLKMPKSEEVRRRIVFLLTKLKVPGSLSLNQERIRLRRILLILEQNGSPQARQILQNLVRGAPEEVLRQEALASLERLGK